MIFLFVLGAGFVSHVALPAARAQTTEATPAGESTSRQPDLQAEQPCGSGQCEQIAAMLKQQNSLLSRELGQLKRELAALRESISRPGLKEAFAGIGYILGLAGIAFLVHGRKSNKGP
jgi:flagellar motility protein MotE (MotC chaperone)